MKIKRPNKLLLKLLIIFLITLSFISISWFVVHHEAESHRTNVINAFKEEQFEITSELSGRIFNALNDYTKNKGLDLHASKEKVISEIIKKETNTDNKYVFFYSTKYVLFEKDDLTTEEYKNKTINEIYSMWKSSGGRNLSYAQSLMNDGISGSSIFSKDSKESPEIVSWCSFETSGEKYIVGISTSQDYVERTTMLEQHIFRIYMFNAVCSMFIIICSAVFSLSIVLTDRRTRRLKKSIESKRVEIDQLTSQINVMNKVVKKANICDTLTGLYNQKFLDAAIPKMNMSILLPIAVIRMDIDNFKSINDKFGYVKGNYVLIKMAEILLKHSSKQDIASRIEDDDFVLVLVDTNEKSANETAVSIKQDIEESFKEYSLTLSFGIAIKKYETQEIKCVLDDAAINMKMSKIENKKEYNDEYKK